VIITALVVEQGGQERERDEGRRVAYGIGHEFVFASLEAGDEHDIANRLLICQILRR
jgi:hypothetical protein